MKTPSIVPPEESQEAVSSSVVEQFHSDGYALLPQMIDPAPLAAEVAAAFQQGFGDVRPTNVSAEASIRFRYLPMMSEHTPRSLELLHHFAAAATLLVGRDVVPVRAKAVEYHGDSSWHRDSTLDLISLGFACYLEPLTADGGALCVRPGSHRQPDEATTGCEPVALETMPGDVIVFDERLIHASHGGGVRYQWRVDYVARPTTDHEHAGVRDYFAGMYSPTWDAGYDVDRYPTYGPLWRRTCRPADDALLDAVGAYRAAAEEESAARWRHTPPRRPQQRQQPQRSHGGNHE